MRAAFKTLLPQNRKNLIGCEIGVANGGHAMHIIEAFDISKMYLIDPIWNEEDKFNIAKNTLSYFLDKVVWIGKKAEDVTEDEIPHNSLDFCYVDGDHSYEAVMKDLNNYWPRIKKNGLFCGHDWEREEVNLAVRTFFHGTSICHDTKSVDWWIYK